MFAATTVHATETRLFLGALLQCMVDIILFYSLDDILNGENKMSTIEQIIQSPVTSTLSSQSRGAVTSSPALKTHRKMNAMFSVCKDFLSFSLQKFKGE